MTTSMKFLGLAGMLLAAAILAGCGDSSDETADGLTKVRVVYQPVSSTLTTRIAKDQGFFEEHGLDVETSEGGELPTYAAALDKQYDFAMAVSGTFLSGAEQLGTVAVTGFQVNVPDLERAGSPLMTDDESIQTPEDLVGKTIGVPVLTGTGAQSIQYLMKKAGQDPTSVTLVQVPFASQLDQLEAGNVDAVQSAIPYSTPLLEAGYDVRFDIMTEATKAATGADSSVNSFYITTRSYAEENPEVVQAFTAAIAEAVAWIKDNDAEARTALEDFLQLPPEIAQAAPWPGLDVEVTPELIEPWIVMQEELGTLEAGLNAEDLVWSP